MLLPSIQLPFKPQYMDDLTGIHAAKVSFGKPIVQWPKAPSSAVRLDGAAIRQILTSGSILTYHVDDTMAWRLRPVLLLLLLDLHRAFVVHEIQIHIGTHEHRLLLVLFYRNDQ